jgi:hypothetical protein
MLNNYFIKTRGSSTRSIKKVALLKHQYIHLENYRHPMAPAQEKFQKYAWNELTIPFLFTSLSNKVLLM